jgi:exonuclease III
MIGDFNTGKHYIDEEGATFLGPEYIDRLEELGYSDAWRVTHQATRDYTWFSSAGNGFRLDYAFLSPALTPRLARAEHIHKTRLEAVTDHSALLVEIGEYTAQQRLAVDAQRRRC